MSNKERLLLCLSKSFLIKISFPGGPATASCVLSGFNSWSGNQHSQGLTHYTSPRPGLYERVVLGRAFIIKPVPNM